jgi:hypothetical protein
MDDDRLHGVLDLLEPCAWISFESDKGRDACLYGLTGVPTARLKSLKNVCNRAKAPLLSKFNGSNITELVTLTTKTEEDEELLASVLDLMPEPENLLTSVVRIQERTRMRKAAEAQLNAVV